MPGWLRNLWYVVFWFCCFWFMTLAYSLRTAGRRRIPRTGPVLIIANHQSFLDPILVGLSTFRQPASLARETLFKNSLFAALITSLGAVPIDQEGIGKEGIKTILAELGKGRAVVVYPEGSRTPDGRLHELRPGISLLIKRVKAPIVPVGIAGAFAAWPSHALLPRLAPLFLAPSERTLAVVVGRPLDGGRFASMPRQQMMDELYQEIAKVQHQAEKLRRK